MLLYEPNSTPFDLSFRIFGVHVRVHPLFWLGSSLLGQDYMNKPVLHDSGLLDLALWIVCVFLSILLHELGHVLMGRIFGSDGHILLHVMGGLAIGASDLRSRWQRMLVIAAGPAIQLLLFAFLVGAMIVAGIMGVSITANPALNRALWMLLGINLLWPVLNLLPIWPLDGGQLTMETCEAISPQKGPITALWISVIVAGFLSLNAIMVKVNNTELIPYVGHIFGGWFMAIFFFFFAFNSWQMIQAETSRRRNYWDDDLPWER